MIELRLDRRGPLKLQVGGRFHLFKELLDPVEASQDRFDDGLQNVTGKSQHRRLTTRLRWHTLE
jgi:hypothetical protein